MIVGFVGGWDDGVGGGGGVSVWMVFLSGRTCLHVLERVAARTRDSRAVVSVAADCSVESVREGDRGVCWLVECVGRGVSVGRRISVAGRSRMGSARVREQGR